MQKQVVKTIVTIMFECIYFIYYSKNNDKPLVIQNVSFGDSQLNF